MAASGKLGVFGDWTLGAVGKDYKDYVALAPIPMGGNDDCYLTRLSWYNTGAVWASSKTEYPEVVAMMIDFIYSDEGAFLYRYGPKQGEDPLGLLDGWYYDKNGDITYAEVENGTYANIQDYQRQMIYPIDSAGVRPVVVTSGSGETITYKDAVTGKDISATETLDLNIDNADNYWHKTSSETWRPYATSVKLGSVWLDEDANVEITDLKAVLNNYITSESAKFITGRRPMSEIDEFWDELKQMDIERYLEIYKEAYAPYMESVFGK
jgi:putative aldouronate transport system substrate-binding protein